MKKTVLLYNCINMRGANGVQKNRKNLIICIATFCCMMLMLCMTSCSKTTSNGLMSGASPNTSALTLYNYNGETTTCSHVYDSKTIQGILEELDIAKITEAKSWSLEDITLPIYGFEIGSTDGTSIFAAWSNGYWISQDGVVYDFDFDFEKLEQNNPWTDETDYSSFTVFPCAYFLSQDENGWNNMLLQPVTENLAPPNGVDIALEAWGSETVSVTITNNSGSEWLYGEDYSLQVLLDGAWRDIPTTSGNWALNGIGLIIQNGEEHKKTYYIDKYGILPTGIYRLVAYGLSVEMGEETEREYIENGGALRRISTVGADSIGCEFKTLAGEIKEIDSLVDLASELFPLSILNPLGSSSENMTQNMAQFEFDKQPNTIKLLMCISGSEPIEVSVTDNTFELPHELGEYTYVAYFNFDSGEVETIIFRVSVFTDTVS